jgi:hypothetical protein
MAQVINGNKSQTRVPCADAFNRRRTVRVLSQLSTDRIALLTPPGESAVLSPHEARTLAADLLTRAAAIDGLHKEITHLASRGQTG